MWGLQSLSNATQLYYLPAEREYTIGRRGTDILIGGDQSVSRVHALVCVDDGGRVWLTDKHSKFGTRVGGVKVESGGRVELQEGAVFTVGQGTSSYRLVRETLTFCCSNMDSASKQGVKTAAAKLGGTLVGNWSTSCTHLVMSSVTVTVKVVCALTNARPIVTMKWLDDAYTCCTDKKMLPLCDSYTPVITDSNLIGHCSPGSGVSLLPSFNRRTLFTNTTVVFLTQSQCSRLRMCVKSAGGTVKLCADGREEDVCGDGVVVISPDRLEDWMAAITDQLDRNRLRLIPESEIGYAVLHCSKETFCNPTAAVEYSQSVASTHIVAPSLSQQDLPTASSSARDSIPYTQTQTDVSILAYNTEGTPGGVAKRRSITLEKVDETIIMKKQMDALFSMDTQPPPVAPQGTTDRQDQERSQETTMILQRGRWQDTPQRERRRQDSTQQDVLRRGMDGERHDTQQDVSGREDDSQQGVSNERHAMQPTQRVEEDDSMVEDSQPTAASSSSPEHHQPTTILPHLRSVMASSMLVPSSLNTTPSITPLPHTGLLTSAFRTKRVRHDDELMSHSKRNKPSHDDDPLSRPASPEPHTQPSQSHAQPSQPPLQPHSQSSQPHTQPPDSQSQLPEPQTEPRTQPSQPRTTQMPFLSSSPFLSARKKRHGQQSEPSTPLTPVVAMDTTAQHPIDTENPLPDPTPSDTPLPDPTSNETPRNMLSIFSNMRSRRMSQPEPHPLRPYTPHHTQISEIQEEIDFDLDEERAPVRRREELEEEGQQHTRVQYEPVLTSDGFICAREVPRHRPTAVGRGRFHQLHAALMREDQATQQDHSSPSSSPPPICRVAWTAILRPLVQEDTAAISNHDDTINTKRFRKVKHAGSGRGHTRMIAGSRMTMYTGKKIFHSIVGGLTQHRPRPQQDESVF